jgi:methyl-accepting chemotaxis protein
VALETVDSQRLTEERVLSHALSTTAKKGGSLMAVIDFQKFRLKHMSWRLKLKDFLEGKGGLSEKQALSHRECSLGLWLYSEGLTQYKHLPDMTKLEKVHKELHDTVNAIITLKNGGKAEEAELEYRKIAPISDNIIALLDNLEKKVKTGG